MRLAIVGSVSLAGNARAEYVIGRALDRFSPTRVVSGGADGIDKMAASAARSRGIEVTEYLPAEPNWERGFKPRNMLIAGDCDVLVRIIARGSKTYGSGWTRDRAKEVGVRTYEVVLDV